jgi:oleate hydratase
MEAAPQLLSIDRGVPEVFNSTYDVRKLMDASSRLRDGKPIEVPLPSVVSKRIPNKFETTEIGELIKEFHLLAEHT